MSLTNRSTLHYEVDDVFDLIVLSNDKNVQRNFDDVTRRASFIYRLPYPLDLSRGWQVALVKMTVPVTDNSQVQDSQHSTLGLDGKSNKVLACIRNTQNNEVVADISWHRNKSYQNFFQLVQDILVRFTLNNTLVCIQNAFSTDDTDIPNVAFFQFAQCVERDTQYKFAVMVDFEPYLKELFNQSRDVLFQRLKSKHSLATKKGWIANSQGGGVEGFHIDDSNRAHGRGIEGFHVDDRHYGINFVSKLDEQNYNGILFTNRFKNASWDVIKLEIGIGLAKLLQIENEEMYNKYWSAPDWYFKETTMTKVSIVIKNPKTFNSKVMKYNVVEESATDKIVSYIGTIRCKNDRTVVVNLPTDYTLELKQPNIEAFTPLTPENGEIDLCDIKHAENFKSFFTRTPKIYNVHLSFLKLKSFVNRIEEQRLYTFTLQGRENETLIVEPPILHYKQLTNDSQHTHLRVDIKNPDGLYPSLYTGALSLQLRLKAFEDEWYQDV